MGRMQTHPTRYPTDLTDEEWNQIKSLVPAPKSGKGKRGRPVELDRRSLLNAIFYVVRSGCAWRLLPSDFGPWQTVYGYFRVWSQDWTWKFIHDVLRDCVRKTEGRRVAPTAAIVDSQSVKTPDQAGERGYDAGKKISGRKRHVAVDCLGLILAMMITPAAVQDRDAARPLIKALVSMYGRLQIIWADGGYLGSLGQLGEATASLRQIETGDCPPLRRRQRFQSPAQTMGGRTHFRLVVQVAATVPRL